MRKLNYTRHLPHQAPDGFPLFITWNLKGAMPVAAIDDLKQMRETAGTATAGTG